MTEVKVGQIWEYNKKEKGQFEVTGRFGTDVVIKNLETGRIGHIFITRFSKATKVGFTLIKDVD